MIVGEKSVKIYVAQRKKGIKEAKDDFWWKQKVTNGPATFFMAPTAVLLTYHEVVQGGGTKLCDVY